MARKATTAVKSPPPASQVAAPDDGVGRNMAQINADIGAIAAFLAKLPGVESSLAVEHGAVREIADRRRAR